MRACWIGAMVFVVLCCRGLPAQAATLQLGIGSPLPVVVAPPTLTIDTVIGFDTLAGAHRSPFEGLGIDGYRLTPLSGNWRQLNDGRDGAPALLVQNVARGDPHVLEISREDGARFQLRGFDIAGFGVFTEVRAGGNSIGGFFPSGTVTSPAFAGEIDRLTIAFTTGSRNVTVSLDDIQLRQVLPVPEPTAVALFLAGLLSLLGLRPRQG